MRMQSHIMYPISETSKCTWGGSTRATIGLTLSFLRLASAGDAGRRSGTRSNTSRSWLWISFELNRYRLARREGVPELRADYGPAVRIIPIPCLRRLARIHQESHVPVPVGVIMVVRAPGAGGISVARPSNPPIPPALPGMPDRSLPRVYETVGVLLTFRSWITRIPS
jgi:hypothetical protein